MKNSTIADRAEHVEVEGANVSGVFLTAGLVLSIVRRSVGVQVPLQRIEAADLASMLMLTIVSPGTDIPAATLIAALQPELKAKDPKYKLLMAAALAAHARAEMIEQEEARRPAADVRPPMRIVSEAGHA